MKILILRFSSMGDVILVSPLLSYLQHYRPDAGLFLVTDTLYAGLYKDDPRLTSCIPYSRSAPKDLHAHLSLHRWDFVIDLQNNRRSRRLRRDYLPGIQAGVFNKHHIRRLALLVLRLDLYGGIGGVVQRYIQASAPLLDRAPRIFPVRLFFNCEETAPAALPPESKRAKTPVLALMPFCAWKNKQWPLTSFAEVGSWFTKKKWLVAILGGPEDVACAETLKDGIGEGAVSLAGRMDLYATGCFLKKCSLALGNDTGLSHLARACGVKTGVIYGATTRHFGFFPYGEPPFRTFESRLLCRPCHPHGGTICWRLSRPCLKKTGHQEVIEGLEELLRSPV